MTLQSLKLKGAHLYYTLIRIIIVIHHMLFPKTCLDHISYLISKPKQTKENASFIN
jgi:hypothetical protein